MELNFKVLKLVMLVLIGIVLIATQSVGGLKCDRQPEGSTAPKTAADGRFRVSVVGNPQKYVPGDSYNSEYFKTFHMNLDFSMNINRFNYSSTRLSIRN